MFKKKNSKQYSLAQSFLWYKPSLGQGLCYQRILFPWLAQQKERAGARTDEEPCFCFSFHKNYQKYNCKILLNSKNGKIAILKNNLPAHIVEQPLRVAPKTLCEHKDMLYYIFHYHNSLYIFRYYKWMHAYAWQVPFFKVLTFLKNI